MNKTVLFFLIGTLFAMITLAGTTYVLLSGGTKSAGYAVIPMIFAIVFLQLWRKSKNQSSHEVH
jgi:hypothetical protein